MQPGKQCRASCPSQKKFCLPRVSRKDQKIKRTIHASNDRPPREIVKDMIERDHETCRLLASAYPRRLGARAWPRPVPITRRLRRKIPETASSPSFPSPSLKSNLPFPAEGARSLAFELMARPRGVCDDLEVKRGGELTPQFDSLSLVTFRDNW